MIDTNLTLENKARNRFCQLSRIGAVSRASNSRCKDCKDIADIVNAPYAQSYEADFWERHIFVGSAGVWLAKAKKGS